MAFHQHNFEQSNSYTKWCFKLRIKIYAKTTRTAWRQFLIHSPILNSHKIPDNIIKRSAWSFVRHENRASLNYVGKLESISRRRKSPFPLSVISFCSIDNVGVWWSIQLQVDRDPITISTRKRKIGTSPTLLSSTRHNGRRRERLSRCVILRPRESPRLSPLSTLISPFCQARSPTVSSYEMFVACIF